MQIEQRFTVKADPGRVWDFLIDVSRVASCLPGAEVTEQLDDNTYAGKMTVKVGPVSASYKGKVHFARLDRAAREAEIAATGQDLRGKGGAEMRMTSRVTETAGGESEVVVQSDVNVTGILAQFGRGMIEDVSNQIFKQFTACLRAQVEVAAGTETAASAPAPAEPEALDVVSLGASAGTRAMGRLLRRPVFWVGVLAVVFVIYWLFVR